MFYNLIIFLLLVGSYSSLLFPMDPPKWMKKAQKKTRRMARSVQQSVQQGAHWVENAGNVLLGNLPPAPTVFLQTIDFPALPEDIQKLIKDLIKKSYYASNLEEAIFTIRSLSRVNKELARLINNPTFCFNMVRHLGKKFYAFDYIIYKVLNTPQAQKQVHNIDELIQLIRIYSQYPLGELLHQIGTFIDMNHINVNFSFIRSTPSPLSFAVEYQLLPLVELLINKGADPFLFIPENQTPLFLAVSLAENNENAMNILKVLIKALPQGALDWADDEELNALCYAILKGNTKTVKVLLDAGSDPEFNNGVPLQIAETANNKEIIDLLNNAIEQKKRK